MLRQTGVKTPSNLYDSRLLTGTEGRAGHARSQLPPLWLLLILVDGRGVFDVKLLVPDDGLALRRLERRIPSSLGSVEDVLVVVPLVRVLAGDGGPR
jgi:hypothetical protein